MDLGTTRPQVTTLFGNDVLSRLERMRLQTRHRFINKYRGEHLSRGRGSSNEFSDYRDYVPGDDVRFVDWNIFARLNRPYLKLYLEEELMHVVILVDASNSMLFEDKLARALQLAAAFGVMGLNGTERVSVYAQNEENTVPAILPACRGRGSMSKLFSFLEGLEGGGHTPLETAIDGMLKFHVGRGCVVILSDFLTFADLRPAFNRLTGVGLEVLGIQVLGPSEIEPEINGDVRFVDSESEDRLDVTAANDLIQIYQEHRLAYEYHLATLCRQRGGRFVSIGAHDPLSWVLFDLLRRRGWIA